MIAGTSESTRKRVINRAELGRFERFVVGGNKIANVFHPDVKLAGDVGSFAGAAIDENTNSNENSGGEQATDEDLEDKATTNFGLFGLFDWAIGLRDMIEILKIIHICLL